MNDWRSCLRNRAQRGYAEAGPGEREGLPLPPIQKPYPQEAKLLSLPKIDALNLGEMPLVQAMRMRRSRRVYSSEALSLEELAFLLWSTQGVHQLVRSGLFSLRSAPSGSGIHPYETYLIIQRVQGLNPGLYRYLALEHKLLPLHENTDELRLTLVQACDQQTFVGNAAVVFLWSARPERAFWRYGENAIKDILIGIGHVCQNLYLACEALGLGTTSILTYQQEALDRLVGLDGKEELIIYLAPVGRKGE